MVGWRLRIEHTTRVTYAGPVVSSLNEARMTPLTLPTQTTLEARVAVGPRVPVWTYNDYWGTFVSVFHLPDPHDDLLIPLTRNEICRLFTGLSRQLATPAMQLHWSRWRRQHQATARACHYRRRALAPT